MTEQLPPLTPDPARAGRTLEQCRKRLARRRTPTNMPAPPRVPVATLERAAWSGFAMAYLLAMAGTVLRILR